MKTMQRKRHLSDAGFSLVELLITMLISGIVTVAAVAFLSLGIRYYGNADDEATIQNESQIATMFLTELLQEAKDYSVLDVSAHPDFTYAFEVIRAKIDPVTGNTVVDSTTGDIIFASSVVALRGNQLWYAEMDPAMTPEQKLTDLAGRSVENAFLASKVESITLDPTSYSAELEGKVTEGLVKLDMVFRVNDRVYSDSSVISLRNKKRN